MLIIILGVESGDCCGSNKTKLTGASNDCGASQKLWEHKNVKIVSYLVI